MKIRILFYIILLCTIGLEIYTIQIDPNIIKDKKKTLLETTRQIKELTNQILIIKKECDTKYNNWYNIFFRPGCYSVRLAPLQAKLESLQSLRKKQEREIENLEQIKIDQVKIEYTK